MSGGIITVLFIVIIGMLCSVIGYIGNKIVDKGEDAIENSIKRKKNMANEGKTENLADRFRQ